MVTVRLKKRPPFSENRKKKTHYGRIRHGSPTAKMASVAERVLEKKKSNLTTYGGWYLPDIIFLELATRSEYKSVQILATRFKHYKRVLNICNAFETFKTRFKYKNIFWILATCLKHLKRVWNICNALLIK